MKFWAQRKYDISGLLPVRTRVLFNIPKSNRFSQYTNERLSKFREKFWNFLIWIQMKVKKAELPTWIYAMFSLCILLIVFTFKRRQNTKKHMVCHHEFQENEVAYRCLEGFSDITWQTNVFNFESTNQNWVSDNQSKPD